MVDKMELWESGYKRMELLNKVGTNDTAEFITPLLFSYGIPMQGGWGHTPLAYIIVDMLENNRISDYSMQQLVKAASQFERKHEPTDADFEHFINRVTTKYHAKSSRRVAEVLNYFGLQKTYSVFTQAIQRVKQQHKKCDIIFSREYNDLLKVSDTSKGWSSCFAPDRTFGFTRIMAEMEHIGAVFLVPRGGDIGDHYGRAYVYLDDNEQIVIGSHYPWFMNDFEKGIADMFGLDVDGLEKYDLHFPHNSVAEEITLSAALGMVSAMEPPVWTNNFSADKDFLMECDECGESIWAYTYAGLLGESYFEDESKVLCEECAEYELERRGGEWD